MTFFERDMKKFFGNNTVFSKKVFNDKSMLAKLNEITNVKITFCTFGIVDNYEGVLVEIINRTHGVIDSQKFRFKDTVSRKNNPHIWVNNDSVSWCNDELTEKERWSFAQTIAEYVAFYR